MLTRTVQPHVDLLGIVECPPDTVRWMRPAAGQTSHAYNGTTAACTSSRYTSGTLPSVCCLSPAPPPCSKGSQLSSPPPVSVQCLVLLRRGSPSPHVPSPDLFGESLWNCGHAFTNINPQLLGTHRSDKHAF